MAAAQRFVIDVQGKQAHGSQPWMSVDPILISAKIIDGLQTIISRNSELTKEGAVIPWVLFILGFVLISFLTPHVW